MTSEAPELLPCPFCGGHASVWTTAAYSCDSAEHVLGCQSCDIFTPFASVFASNKPTETDAAAWNSRAYLPHKALEAARAEGRRAGREEAAEWHDLEATHYGSACGQKDGVDFALVAEWHKQHAEAIRALIDTPADPVAEAARVLLNDIRVTTMFCAAMFAGEDPPKSYADADAWVCKTLRALAQKEGE